MPLDLSGKTLQFVTPMMRGPSVVAIQRALISLGYLDEGGDDGLFGSGTRDAVIKFQIASGLSADGKVDPDTEAALDAVLPAEQFSGGSVGAGPQVVDPSDLPPARPKRVILHWTGGTNRASALDRSHYHFVIEGDGRIVKGIHGIDANDRPHTHPRASHTRNLNSHSVGISLCGMHDARERPFDPGRFPLREIQVETLAKLVAQICLRYDIPVERKTVLGHGEVQDILNVAQRSKWDPLVLPWQTGLSFRETGDYLRGLISAAMETTGNGEGGEEGPDLRNLTVAGIRIEQGAVNFDTATWLRLDRLARALSWPTPELVGVPEDDSPEDDADGVRVIAGELQAVLAHRLVPIDDGGTQELCVRAEDLAEALEMGLDVSPDGTSIVLTGGAGVEENGSAGSSVKFVTVGRGDTLSAIARRELGDSTRWRDLRDETGNVFTPATTRSIRAGQRIMLPQGAERPQLRDAGSLPDDLVRRAAKLVGAAADPGNKTRAEHAVPGILAACQKCGITDLSHIAYVLATAQHECNFGHPMTEKWRNSAAQQRYENSSMNEQPGDGQRFLGRGYVQLTFRKNYRRYGKALGWDFEGDPDMVERPEIAAEVLAYGMSREGFTGRRQILSAYGEGASFDFDNARRMINGDKDKFERRYGEKKGKAIGDRARKFRAALQEAGLADYV